MRRSLIGNQNFRRYFAGTTVSVIGSSLTDSVWPVLTFWVTGSPLVTALTVGAQVVPHLIFGLISGVQVDRARSRRAFLIYPNLVSALAFFVCASLGVDSFHSLIVALSCYFVSECAAIYYSSAIPAILPRMVEKEQLASARSVVAVIVNLITLGLPGLAVFILSQYGARPLFLTDGLSFLLAALILSRISQDILVSAAPEAERRNSETERSVSETERPAPGQSAVGKAESRPGAAGKMWRDIKEGFRYLWHKRDVRLLTLAGVFNAACGGAVLSQYVVLAHDSLGLAKGDPRYSLFVYAMTLGAAAGALCFPKLKTWCRPVLLSAWLFGANAVFLIGLCFTPGLVGTLLVFALYQATYSAIIMNAIVLRMEIVADEYLGRVSATGRFISWGAAPVGAVICGALLDAGYPVTLVFPGFVALPVIGCLFLLVNHLRAGV